MPPTGVEGTGVGHPSVEEPAGEADGAELQRARGQHLALLTDEQLRAAAADVAQQQARVEHRHRLEHAEVDEARFLHAGDDRDEHAGFVGGPVDEHVAVLRLAHRRGGHRGDGRAVHLGHLAEAIEGGDGTIDGVGAELPHVARARPEADHLLLAIEDLEARPAVAGGHASDHAVHGVGADVDSRQRLRGRFGRRQPVSRGQSGAAGP